jgi:NAD(P)-dependent dehydrogenase (short-subunit alcohol dehydrogenase family)
MAEKTILVTGASDGIGKETARGLAERGARVLVHGRSRAKVEAACEEIRERQPEAKVEAVVADFSSLAEVRALTQEVERRTSRLDVLINNAGVYLHHHERSADGLELTFAVNHLAHFVLTVSLLPLLRRSAPARVVTVTSVAHRRGRIDLEDLQAERHFDGYGAYANSKLANVLFTVELAERLEGSGVTANCLHPGVIGTKLLRAGFSMSGASVEEGARTPLYLALSEEVEGVSGRYFVDCRETPMAPSAQDAALRRALWAHSERLAGLA